MKREKLFPLLWNFVIAASLAVGSAGCLATAFDMTFTSAMLWPILIFTAFFCFWGSVRWGFWPCIAIAGLFLGLFWTKLDLILQFEALIYHISRYYSSAYGWPTISWSGESLYSVSRDGALACIGCLVGFYAAFATARGRSSIPAALVALLPLVACLVVTDTVPESGYLFLFLFGTVLLVMTQPLRSRDPVQGARLSGLLCVPLALAMTLLFTLIPQEGYTPPPSDLAYQIEDWFMGLQTADPIQQIIETFNGLKGRRIDLKYVGPKSQSLMAVMEVTSYETGPLYLRGKTYDTYDGTMWSQSTGEWVLDHDYVVASYFSGTAAVPRGEIHILTLTAHDVLYTPYNPDPALLERMERGQIDNTERLQDYTVTQWNPAKSIIVITSGRLPSLDEEAMAQYLQLPEQTRERALEYLQTHLGFTSVEDLLEPGAAAGESSRITIDEVSMVDEYFELANAIADHVRTSAYYDLRTARMPSGETDFALWFLEDSDTGYCVHFATAAAVLLRAAGVPCRYVTGYLAQTVAGEAVTVQGGDAHAWVEFWVPGCGWQMLEATGSPASEETESSNEATTEPAETRPEETTAPDDATRPDTTAPSGGSDEPGKVKIDLSGFWRVLRSILLTASAIALILGQRVLRLWLREKRRNRGSPKRQALWRWRESEFLCKLLRREPPTELWELARKAKFSQHRLTGEELERFEAYRMEVIAQLRQRPWYARIFYRLVLALY